MKRALAGLAVAMACSSSPALATGEMSCGNGKGVGIDLLVGHVDYLSVARIVIDVDGKTWSSQPDAMPGTPIVVGPAFEDDRQLLLDVLDAEASEVVARLRLFKLQEGETTAKAGVLSVKGEGAWPVECSEDE